MKFAYGSSDFKSMVTEGYYYCDRTSRIPLLENAKSQLFIRPRRFGKSLLLSMLENYYDVAKKDEFDRMFGHLAIGKNPTPLRNSYFILKFDFSCVDPTGTADDVKGALFDHINESIKRFMLYYREHDLPKIEVNRENAISSLSSLLSSTSTTPYPVFLLIDEYDNFANTVMMGIQRITTDKAKDELRYQSLVHEQGPLRTLFKAIKAFTSGNMFDRVFITGVSPVVMSDITSGYNVAKDIYSEPEFNDLCGFTHREIEDMVKKIVQTCELEQNKTREAVELMKSYYNGYRFSHLATEYIYNPTLCIYFGEQFKKSCQYPRKMLDANLAADESKLAYIAELPNGRDILLNLMEKDQQIVVSEIQDRFGIQDMLSDSSHDHTFLLSFLYYFGVLTIAGETDDLQIVLKVPNLVIKSLYIDRICRMFLPEPQERDQGKEAARKLWSKADIAPLCRFMEEKYFRIFHNRDYRWANELTIKTAFLTLLYNDLLYIMDSEPSIDRRYADLTMIIRPDKRHGKLFDILVEFKFVTLKKAKISGEAAKRLTKEELIMLPSIVEALSSAEKQVEEYGAKLEGKYENLRLQKFAVIALGFERICFKNVNPKEISFK